MIKKNSVLLVLILILMAVCTCASAQSFTFREISATLNIPDNYIMLTSDNLNRHEEWVAASGKTAEQLIEEWAEEGVLLIAEAPSGDARLVVTAVQDEAAAEWYDLDQQSDKVRTSFANGFTKNTNAYAAGGIKFTSAEWKKKDQYGRFLYLKYKRTDESDVRGYAFWTIRNGYTIMLDYQVTGRNLKTNDAKALDGIMSTLEFTQVNQKPATCVMKAIFNTTPPTETNTGKFTVDGICDAGLTLNAVLMRMSTGEKSSMETTVPNNGKFSMNVQLPSEGIWLMTVGLYNGDTLVQEEIFDVITYRETLLPVNLDMDYSLDITGDTLNIAGNTIKGVQIQCIVNDKFDKIVTTNGTGRFSFKVPSSTEGTYNITLTFQKKGFDERRFTFAPKRIFTQEYIVSKAKKDAIKPAYSQLMNKLSGYVGRTMKYTGYIVSFIENGDEWLVTMAMERTSDSNYRNLFVVSTKDEPDFTRDSKQTMYGICTGPYIITDGDEQQTLPSFDLLFWN